MKLDIVSNFDIRISDLSKMLPKKFKLPIDLFPKDARTVVRSEHFVIKSSKNSLTQDRLGVIFKSKSFKTAVLRNKFRRIVFNFFRESPAFKTKVETGQGRDLLVILNPSIIPLGTVEINNLLKKHNVG